MAEHKNTFTKSRMNKDLDARLLPRGEYRNATNVSISKSEDEGVGSLENIKGNSLLKKATTEVESSFKEYSDLLIIGDFVDVSRDRVYLFLTRYSDGSDTGLANFSLPTTIGGSASILHWIVCVEIKETGTSLNVLCTGNFLNFSQTHPVLGINVIEDLLFWTDNRNQPRKLNIDRALTNASYYNSEDKISLAKYFPYEPISFLETNADGYEDTSMKNVTQKWLPATNSPTIAFPACTGPISSSFVVDGVDCHAFQVYTYYDYYEVAQWYLSGIPKVARSGGYGMASVTPTLDSVNYFPGDKRKSKYPYNTVDSSTYNDYGGCYNEGTNFSDGLVRRYLPPPFGWSDLNNNIANGYGGLGQYPYNKFDTPGDILGGQASDFPGDGRYIQFEWDSRDIARKQLVTTYDQINDATVEFDNDCRLLQAVPFKFGWEWSGNVGDNPGGFGSNFWNGKNSFYDSNVGSYWGIPSADTYNINRIWLWSISIYAPATSSGGINPQLSKMREICVGEQMSVGSGQNGAIGNTRNGPTSPKPKLSFHYPNPNYIDNFEDREIKIDDNFLKEKFVRFSYRFKYEDDEYSLIAPFTQSAFIPEQYGHFLGTDEEKARKSLDVNFMQNYVNQINLKIPLPCKQSELKTKFLIDEIEILYKESDEIAIKHIDKLEVTDLQTQDEFVNFIYNSSEPSKVLPESENVRVFDKTPVRALTQESVGNRVIFGNFIDKPKAPKELQYQLGYESKSFASGGSGREYPLHNVKQNRTYQVGVVLSDRYGRQSDVLTTVFDRVISSDNPAPGSTIYIPYKDSSTVSNTIQYFGSAIKFELINYIPSSIAGDNSYPGIYSENNPLGWYSYKIVVKQQEQDYYNVYVPGIQSRIMYKKGWSKYDINPLSYCYQNQMLGGWQIQGYQYAQNNTTQEDYDHTQSWSAILAASTTTEQMDTIRSFWGYPFYNKWTGAMATVRTLDQVDFLYKPSNPKYQIELSGDNINKVPRSLINVGPNDRDFAGSDVGLYCRVSSKQWNRNFQFFPSGEYPKSDKVEQIREFNTFNVEPADTIPIEVPGLRVYPGYPGVNTPGGAGVTSFNDRPWYGYFTQNGFKAMDKAWAVDPDNPLADLVDSDANEIFSVGNVPLYDFYNAGNELRKENSLLIASVDAASVDGKYIIGPESSYKGKNSRWTRLGVFETTPTKSQLEVFWETSTTGLISEINEALLQAGGPDQVTNFWANSEHPNASQIPSDVKQDQLWITSIGNRYVDGWEQSSAGGTSAQSNAYATNNLTWQYPASANSNVQIEGSFNFTSAGNWSRSQFFDPFPADSNQTFGLKGNIQLNSFSNWMAYSNGGVSNYYVACVPAVGNTTIAFPGEVVSLAEVRKNGVVKNNFIKLNPDIMNSEGVQLYNFEVLNQAQVSGFESYPFVGGDQITMDFNVSPIVTGTFSTSVNVVNVCPFIGLIYSKYNNTGPGDRGVEWFSKVNPNVNLGDTSVPEDATVGLSGELGLPLNQWSERYSNEADERDADGDIIAWASEYSNGKVLVSNNEPVGPVQLVSVNECMGTAKALNQSGWPSNTTLKHPITSVDGQIVNWGQDVWFCNGNYSDKQDTCTVSIVKVFFAGFNASNMTDPQNPTGSESFGSPSGWPSSNNAWSTGVEVNGFNWIDVTSHEKFQIKRITSGNFTGGFYIATKNYSSWTNIPDGRVYWQPAQQGGLGVWQLASADPKVNFSQPISVDGNQDYGGLGVNGGTASNTEMIETFINGGVTHNYRVWFKITDSQGGESPNYEARISVGQGR